MEKEKKFKKLEPIQYLASGGFVFLLIASICSIIYQEDWSGTTLIPYYKIVIPAVNWISTIVCVFIFFFPEKHIFLIFVLLLEAVFSSLTGIESLGVFLFSLAIVLIYLNGGLSGKKQKITIVSLYLGFTIALLGTLPYGKARFLMAVGCTYFFASGFYCIILTYTKKLKALIPAIQQELYISKAVHLPKPGEVMHLKEYDISERQQMILYESMAKNKTYGEIAMKTKLSLSLVKKEMNAILQYFGCRNANSLKIVLSQFVLSMD